MIKRARTVARRVRRWSRGPADRCAGCGGPAAEGRRVRFEGFVFCSAECAGDWQAAEVAP